MQLKRWVISFNDHKCKVLHLGRRLLHSWYTMRDIQLCVTEIEKDLGVLIDPNLKFRRHASAAAT